MNNLVIGDTSQLSRYFPEDHRKISSRNIDYDFIASRKWDRIFLCFAEQRTFYDGNPAVFFDVNCSYTISVIRNIMDHCNTIYFYSTTYLWNAYEGAVDLSMPYRYYETPYIKSKELISNYIKENIPNAIILYPCNFNSVYRKPGFLFYKIFDSIIHKKKVTIGNTHFVRELVHPRYVVQKSLRASAHAMIGAGYGIEVNGFIRDLYKAFGLEYETFVKEEIADQNNTKAHPVYFTRNDVIDYTYGDLLRDTIEGLGEYKKW